MKDRYRSLTCPQQILLLAAAALLLLFLILYLTLGRQQVIEYHGARLRQQVQGETTAYSGRLNGRRAVFTVSPGPSVEFQYGDVLYGPYIITEDPSAIPPVGSLPDVIHSSGFLTGIEIRKGTEVWFRGAYYEVDFPLLVWEDGTILTEWGTITVATGAPDPEPSVLELLRIALDPRPASRGNWAAFGCGFFLCLVCAVTLLFANELFRWNLSFRIRDPERAEPSEWELSSRWVGWIAGLIGALAVFLMGLCGI